MIVDTDSDNPNQVFCRKLRCRNLLGERVENEMAIEIGNVRIWTPVVLTCRFCGKPYRFFPRDIDAELYKSLELEERFNY